MKDTQHQPLTDSGSRHVGRTPREGQGLFDWNFIFIKYEVLQFSFIFAFYWDLLQGLLKRYEIVVIGIITIVGGFRLSLLSFFCSSSLSRIGMTVMIAIYF